MAAEVEKYFETKVKPDTIFQRARRMKTDTNVSPAQPAETTTETTKLEKLEKPKHGAGKNRVDTDAGL